MDFYSETETETERNDSRETSMFNCNELHAWKHVFATMMTSDLFQLELDSPLAYLLEHENKIERITSRRKIEKSRGLA